MFNYVASPLTYVANAAFVIYNYRTFASAVLSLRAISLLTQRCYIANFHGSMNKSLELVAAPVPVYPYAAVCASIQALKCVLFYKSSIIIPIVGVVGFVLKVYW